ncbi:hypothetical protein D3C75_926350 [compost metagenome]
MRLALDVREDAFALARFHLDNFSFTKVVRCFLIRHLNHLKFEIGCQPFGIFCDAERQIFLL